MLARNLACHLLKLRYQLKLKMLRKNLRILVPGSDSPKSNDLKNLHPKSELGEKIFGNLSRLEIWRILNEIKIKAIQLQRTTFFHQIDRNSSLGIFFLPNAVQNENFEIKGKRLNLDFFFVEPKAALTALAGNGSWCVWYLN